jgi:pimeloyl-ACP methyl ester carboxylesterase
VSVPPSLRLEPEVRPGRLPAPSGDLAALVGEPPAGTPPRAPVLLVPGYTGSKEDFLPVLAPLARAGHRALAVDLRGQHESTGDDDPALYTIEALAKDVAGALASLGRPAHLAGHSFGGLVARRAVLDGTRPLSLTLVGSGPGGLGGNRAAIVGMMRSVITEGGLAAIADASAALDRENPRMVGLPAEVIDFLRRRWLASSPTGLLVMGDELVTAADEVDALVAAADGLPLLVVHGEADDAWTPAEQRSMAHRLGARYAVVPGSVHSPACEAPAAFVTTLLDFWEA